MHSRLEIWITQDPLGIIPEINPYRYVSSMPIIRLDPTGLADDTCNFSICANKVGGIGQHLYLVVRQPGGDTDYRGGPSTKGAEKGDCKGGRFGKLGQLITTTGPKGHPD